MIALVTHWIAPGNASGANRQPPVPSIHIAAER